MNPPEPNPCATRSAAGRLLAGWLMVFFLLLYPLSVGPAIKLLEHGSLKVERYEQFYAPLIYLTEKCPPIRDFFNWYVVVVWRYSPRFYKP